MNNMPPDGGDLEVPKTEDPNEHGGGKDLAPVTPLQGIACHTFNRNGKFANKTQKNQFLALEGAYPDAYLGELMEWASDKGFKPFVSAVGNPDNYNRWQDRQACRPPRLKEI